MNNKYVEFILGLNLAALVRGIRFGMRAAYRSSRASFAAINPWENSQLKSIPIITLDDILGARSSLIKLKVMAYEDGMLPSRDGITLLSVLVAEHPREILEIGTYMGHTARAMAENLTDAIVHTIDLPTDFSTDQPQDANLPKDDFHLIRRRVVGREFKSHACETRIIQHFGDTADFDFTKIGNPAFFFIDGSHTYEYCKNDSEKCFTLCRGNGVFLWHDCDQAHPGVVRFISEWRDTGRNIARIEGTSLAYWKNV
jgi:hypothetical protein